MKLFIHIRIHPQIFRGYPWIHIHRPQTPILYTCMRNCVCTEYPQSTAALKFCFKTCVAMKFVDDDDDDDDDDDEMVSTTIRY